MHDSLISEFKLNSKPHHQVIDYRNAKYQGMADGISINRNGVGVVLDHNYMLALAIWKSGKINGESLIIYPDSSLFYGEIKNKYPIGIGCYQISKKCKIFSSLGRNQQDQFILNDCQSSSLIFVSINRQIMKKMNGQRTADEDTLSQLYKNNEKLIKIDQKNNLRTGEEKWKAIQQFFSLTIQKQCKDYKSFLKSYFGRQESIPQNVVQISQGKDEFQFKFKNSSIVCKITQNKIHQHQLDYKLKCMGFYDNFTTNMDICKKYNFNHNTVQEIVQGKAITYQQAPSKRPQECLKRLHKYYKQSLNFVNEFIELDYLYQIKFIFRNVEQFIEHYSTIDQAQKLLQNPTINISQEIKKKQETPLPLELHRVKEDIYRAVQKKSLSKSKSYSQNKYYQDHIPSAYEQPSFKVKDNTRNDQADFTSPHRRQKKYLQEQSSFVASNKQRGKRSYVYLQESRRQTKNKSKNSPQKEYFLPITMKTRQNRTNLSKYAYLEEEGGTKKYQKTNQRLQNLRALTSYYEQVQSQLRKETTKQTPTRPDKSGTVGNIRKNQRSLGLQYSNQVSMQRRRTSQKQIDAPSINPFPLGPRKVLKYA